MSRAADGREYRQQQLTVKVKGFPHKYRAAQMHPHENGENEKKKQERQRQQPKGFFRTKRHTVEPLEKEIRRNDDEELVLNQCQSTDDECWGVDVIATAG
ncbi:hypothetical protein Q1695_007474 [Nippostrongylus brasiliensis]|nr:hypothetical protein Q1695_007474 [Nippostrongylus brasiliensis]